MKVCSTVFIALFGIVSVLFAGSEADSIVTEEHPCPCNEVWSDCGPPQGGCFERICGDPSLEGTACKAPCRPSCYCRIGFIRRSADGPCIPEDKCPIICTTTEAP